MSTVAARKMTADEFFDFVHRPENRDRVLELERGEVVEMSRPGKLHGLVCANIAFVLGFFARTRKRGYPCSNDTGVVVEQDPDTVRGPDILFFDDAESIEDVERKFAKTPPLLAVEVLSPTDTLGKTNRKVQEQLRFGTGIVWVVDPDERNVSVYRRGKQTYVVEENEEITGEDVLPDFRWRVAEFFELPGRQTAQS